MNNIFSIARFTQLIKRYYVLNYRRLLIEVSAAIGILSIIGGLSARNGQDAGHMMFVAWFYILAIVGGLILTSGIFSELHKPEKSIQFLTLPASSTEKFLSGWFITTVAFIIISICAYYIAFTLTILLAKWWFDADIVMKSLSSFGAWNGLRAYLIIHTVFLFGAIYFRGKNFFKTVFSLFALSLFFSLYHSLVGSTAMNEISTIFMEENTLDPSEVITVQGLEEYAETVLVPVMKVLFNYVTPAFFLITGYICFKEREV